MNKNYETILNNDKFVEKPEPINNLVSLMKQQNPFKI